MRGWVYILKLGNGKYYVGSTSDIEKREEQHRIGFSTYTSKFLPITLVFKQEYTTYREARRIEMWLKNLKNKGIIEKIVSEGRITKRI